MEQQKVEEAKQVEVDKFKEWEVEKISNKNKRSNKVLSVLEEIYSRIWYLEEKERLRKYKEDSS